ncbi:uncharacterized protein LOC128729993 [Anopheles nili]|uniref:uncharacterized protein LOC128729993 n=1 Tax=Anopheles nili TaxID=185578 RepID=UPI00237C4590|nr:uncharacterized protein LOC128729993 [Anopheles nili]
MMTRRKSVQESSLQMQIQLQERAAEEQLEFGAIATGIANILSPSSCSSSTATATTPSGNSSPYSVIGTPQSGLSGCSGGMLPQQSTTAQIVANGLDTKKTVSISNVSSTAGWSTPSSVASMSAATVTTNIPHATATKPATANRSKTPRVSKRSAPADSPIGQSTSSLASTTTNCTNTVPTTGHVTGGIVGATVTNPVQQTLAQNGMDPDEIPNFKGYRIIEIDHFLQWAAYSQFMHSKHCPGGLLKPYQEYISGCYSTFAMKCSKCSAIITRSSENYIHHNKLMNRLVKGTVQLGKDYDEMQQFMDSLEIPFVTREEFQSIRGQVSSSLEDQSALQRAVEELERASSVSSKRKRHGSCKYHYEVLKVYLNKRMKKIEENLQLSVNDSVALAVNAHLKNVSHVQLVPNGHNSTTTCTAISGTMNGYNPSPGGIVGSLGSGLNVQNSPVTLSGSNSSMYSLSSVSSSSRSGIGGLSLSESVIGGGGGRLPSMNH